MDAAKHAYGEPDNVVVHAPAAKKDEFARERLCGVCVLGAVLTPPRSNTLNRKDVRVSEAARLQLLALVKVCGVVANSRPPLNARRRAASRRTTLWTT